MKVVFVQDVANVAKAGDVKNVADGYARNYLFPKKLAVLATPHELKRVEALREASARREEHTEHEAEALAAELGNLTVTIKVRAGTAEKIYGSVTSADIAKELKRVSGHDIDRHSIELDSPIRELGSHQVTIKLTRNVSASIGVTVEQQEDEKDKAKEKEKPKTKAKAKAKAKAKEPKEETKKEPKAKKAKQKPAEPAEAEPAEVVAEQEEAAGEPAEEKVAEVVAEQEEAAGEPAEEKVAETAEVVAEQEEAAAEPAEDEEAPGEPAEEQVAEEEEGEKQD
jgi:large subunit ribosomal protein L9